jgi:hypothetical protein
MYEYVKAQNAEKLYNSYISIADVVWVTNQQLYDYVLPLNKNIQIIPNGLPFGHEQYAEFNNKSGKKSFTYIGNISHVNDMGLVKSAIKAINKQPIFEKNWAFRLLGIHQQTKDKLIRKTWDIAEDIFKGGKKNNPNYIPMSNKGINEYMYSVGLGTVGIAPLIDDDFNRHKSNLKILEYASKKMPCIISGVISQMQGNPPCIVAKTPKEWEDAFMYYMKDESRIVEDGERLNKWAKNNFDIKITNYKRIKSINDLFI